MFLRDIVKSDVALRAVDHVIGRVREFNSSFFSG